MIIETTCPNCKFIFKSKGNIIPEYCPNKVSKCQAHDKIKKIQKHWKKGLYQKEGFLEVVEFVRKLKIGEKINQPKVTSLFGWNKHSDGDFVRSCLDNLICMGFLSKIKYLKGRGGHKWIRRNIKPCKYFRFHNGCVCPKNLFKEAKEGEYEIYNQSQYFLKIFNGEDDGERTI